MAGQQPISIFIHHLLILFICCAPNISPFDVGSFPNGSFPQTYLNSPCRYTKDDVYLGILVDCQGQGLTSVPSAWIPPKTTTLFLQSNSLEGLEHDSFHVALELRSLQISNNNLRYIHHSAFGSNRKLVFLDLESNFLRLDNISFDGVFSHLRNLAELRMAHNHMEYVGCGAYSPGLLDGLSNLRTLTIDTFSCDLNFGGIFNNTRNLTSLKINGGMVRILNDSFQPLERIALKSLTINSETLILIERGAFQCLKDLNSFSISGGTPGLTMTLESLAPFAGRNFTALNIDDITNEGFMGGCNADSVLTPLMTRFLTQICVPRVSLTNNGLFYVQPESLTSGLWLRCLESLDISDNPISGNKLEIFRLKMLDALRSFRFTNRKYSCLNTKLRGSDQHDTLKCSSSPRTRVVTRIYSKTKGFKNYYNSHIFYSVKNSVTKCHVDKLYNSYSKLQGIDNIISNRTKIPLFDVASNRKRKPKTDKANHDYSPPIRPTVKVYLPREITYLNMNRNSYDGGSLTMDAIVKGADNLREIHISDGGYREFTARYKGLENVKVLDISLNDGSIISSRFIQSLPMLSKLNMSGMNLDNAWILNEGKDFFCHLPHLISLDLSANNLYFMSSDMLSANKGLKGLGLSKNRFKTIPLDLRLLTNLCHLDLRSNSILRLGLNDMRMLDEHSLRMDRRFSVKFEGNIFSCGCSSIRFLSWLQATFVELDNNRNYSCILETGELTTTYQVKDLKALWRKCNGETAFLISLIVASFMTFCFCIAAMGMKFHTQIRASALRYFGRRVPVKRPNDYLHGVYLGYSDQDLTLACFRLRNFIENELRLSTYLRHRDLLPASDLAESIVTAISSSWRVVLLLTDDYMQYPWSLLAMKTAIYTVDAANMDRVVIIFTSRDLPRHPVTTSVLNIVSEHNIIYLTTPDGLDDKDRQRLRRALLS